MFMNQSIHPDRGAVPDQILSDKKMKNKNRRRLIKE